MLTGDDDKLDVSAQIGIYQEISCKLSYSESFAEAWQLWLLDRWRV